MLFKWGPAMVMIFSFTILSCNNNTIKKFENGSDSLGQNADSTSSVTDACYTNFFSGLQRFSDSNSAYLIVDSNKRMTLTQYFRDEFMSPVSSYGIKDLDGDGTPELIIYNNTGGAHCCDEFTIFSQLKPEEYQFKARVMGDVCIDAATNVLTFSFGESLGYFFSCYACTFQDSASSMKVMRALRLAYKSGKLEVIPYSKAEEEQNVENLNILYRHGYEKMQGMMDNGWRKEFAINTAIWHFNHAKDWTSTKTLFDRYYRFPDRTKVWNELYQNIVETSRENTF